MPPEPLFEVVMPPEHRAFLENDRLLSPAAIDKFVQYTLIDGQGWFAFPVRNTEKETLYWKLRAAPGNASKTKARFWPTKAEGAGDTLYAGSILSTPGINRVFVCEGELDCILLLDQNLPAVTSNTGAATWKDEWCALFPEGCEVVLCFDHDTAGDSGRKKVAEAFMRLRPDCAIAHIRFDEFGKKGFDVTDFFFDRVQDPTCTDPRAEFMSRIEIDAPEAIKLREIPQVPAPVDGSIITLDEWRAVINKHFPGLSLAAEVCASIFCQLLIFDVHNPFALILTDRPSTGKTICINFFDDLGPLTYMTDTFSQASFVSNIAGRTAEQLEKIDLLPKIRHKTLLIREMATMLAENDDKLRERMGQLTRVLDGEGFLTESGVYGQRGYRGEYNFMLIGASTAFPLRVWKVMSGLGHRLFFLGLHTKNKSEDDLLLQNVGLSFKKKEGLCREATKELLYRIWTENKDGIEWARDEDDEDTLRIIAKAAIFLSHFRGEILTYSEKGAFGSGERETQTTAPKIEDPSRIFTCLTNLARGHAVLCGRSSITNDDLRVVLPVVIDTAPERRVAVLKVILGSYGLSSVYEIRQMTHIAQKSAQDECQKLIDLGVCEGNIRSSVSYDAFGAPPPPDLWDGFMDTADDGQEGGGWVGEGVGGGVATTVAAEAEIEKTRIWAELLEVEKRQSSMKENTIRLSPKFMWLVENKEVAEIFGKLKIL